MWMRWGRVFVHMKEKQDRSGEDVSVKTLCLSAKTGLGRVFSCWAQGIWPDRGSLTVESKTSQEPEDRSNTEDSATKNKSSEIQGG